MRAALCLSGGGFRATLFHVGTLKRLNELGILSRLTTICSVSGGSITNGVLATRWDALKQSQSNGAGAFLSYDELIAGPIFDFCRKDLRTEILFWDRLNPLNWIDLIKEDYSVTDRLAVSYSENLSLGQQLDSLPSEPEFVFLATNMGTGGPWEFRKDQMGDWYVGYTATGKRTVGHAVAASSAYTVTFPPLRLSFNSPQEFHGGHDKRVQNIESVTLTDGGVYDNLGIEPVRSGHDYLLVSDAGHPLIDDNAPSLSPYARVIRSLDIISNQVGAQRKRWLIEAFKSNDIQLDGAYWGLSSNVLNYGIPEAPGYPEKLLPLLQNVRTDLDPFTEGEIGCLVNHGYALANVAAKRWLPKLIYIPLAEYKWPFPEWVEDVKVTEALSGSADRGILKDLIASWKKRIE